VQLNIEFDLPLSDGKLPLPTLTLDASKTEPSQSTLEVPVDDDTVVIAGAGGAAARDFAEQANLPLIAEPSSGARSGDHALQFPVAALEANRERIKRAIVFGKPTLSRSVQSLISSVEVFTQSGHGYGDFNPHGNVSASADQLIPLGRGSDENLARYQLFSEPDERQEFVAKVWSLSDRLVIGASDLIRQLDMVAEPKDIEVYSNRGLAGIDGTVSTALGVALERGETTLLVGDLTLLHDAAGLNLSDLGSPQLRIVVGNDRGGHIFSRLEVAQELSEEDLSRLFVTPQQVDIAALAAAYGWDYRVCNSPAQLAENWEISGPTVIEYLL
jgi:2-succinyl-5-enolpyruvyl-6-hydroxy-3-cyclohexene-1-carboxylate synthase